MASLGMSPALYAAQLAQYGMLSGMHKTGDDSDQEAGEVKKDDDSKREGDSPSSKSSSTPSMHPSFPYMYNPLLFNQLYAQSLAAANFQLPTNVTASFASLAAAQQNMMNGMAGRSADSDAEAEPKPEAEQDAAEDLSVRSHSSKSKSAVQEHVADFTVKKKRREHRHHDHQSAADLSMNSASTSLDLSLKSSRADKSASLDLSVKCRESHKKSPETTPEKSKPPVMAKHKSPKALMDVIKELKSNKQKVTKSRNVSSKDDGSKTNISPSKSTTSPDKSNTESLAKESGEAS